MPERRGDLSTGMDILFAEDVFLMLLRRIAECPLPVGEDNGELYCHPDSRQGCRLRSERHAVTQGRIRRQVLTGLQDHYRGQDVYKRQAGFL